MLTLPRLIFLFDLLLAEIPFVNCIGTNTSPVAINTWDLTNATAKGKNKQKKKHIKLSDKGVSFLPVNAHAKFNILNLNYITSFIFYSSATRLSNYIN